MHPQGWINLEERSTLVCPCATLAVAAYVWPAQQQAEMNEKKKIPPPEDGAGQTGLG